MSNIQQDSNKRKLLKNRIIPFLFLPLLLLASSHSTEIPEHPAILEGIDVVFNTEPCMFPPKWYCKNIGAKAVSLPKEFRTGAMDILNRAIAKYPEEVLFVYLRKVYVLKSLSFFGFPYGATNTRDIIYITYDNVNPERHVEYVEGNFHHEFSSILYRKFHSEFDSAEWIKANPPDFKYKNGSIEAIKNGEASTDYDYTLLPIGFLNEYSLSAVEEDINVYAQHLFSGGKQFWALVDTFPKAHEKALLMVEFYHRIDSIFTEEYFRALAYTR